MPSHSTPSFFTKRSIPLVSAALGIAIVLSGCASEPEVASAPAGADVVGDGGEIELLVNPSGSQTFAPSIIKDLKLDEKYGFNLTVTESTDPVTVLRTGEGDGMLATWNVIASLANANIGFTGVAPFATWVNNVVASTDAGIDDVGDLKGKNLGILGKTSSDWFILKAYAEQEYGLDLEADSTLQEATSPALLKGLIQQGQIEATQMWFNLTPDMTAGGGYKDIAVMKDMAEAIGLPSDVAYLIYGFTDEYIAANPENVRAFVLAYEEAVEVLRTDDSVWPDLAAGIGIEGEGEAEVLRDLTRDVMLTEFDSESEATLVETAETLIPLVGADNLGFSELPSAPLITLDYQP